MNKHRWAGFVSTVLAVFSIVACSSGSGESTGTSGAKLNDFCGGAGASCGVGSDCCSGNCNAFSQECIGNGATGGGGGFTSDAGGVDSACVPAQCPKDVCNLRFPDGCGNELTCNTCLKGLTCDNGFCSAQDASCTKDKCPTDGTCGTFPDACGGQLNCGCGAGQECFNGACRCKSRTDLCSNNSCGPQDDGCGNIVVCHCYGSSTCQYGTCQEQCVSTGCGPYDCGQTTDNCGNTINCGGAPGSETECSDACGHPINDGQDCTFSPLNEVGRCFDGTCMTGT
jgi:hypothetical protein